MGEQKSTRKTVWIYAVVLFTSAFIVLLLTAYSQIKFNRNIDQYREELSSKEKERLNYQLTLNSALESNKKIKQELENLKKNLMDDKGKESYEKEIEEYKNEKIRILNSYEALISAEQEYRNGNIIESARILVKKCDKNLLKEEALETYNDLNSKVVSRASYKLYTEGYLKFRNKKYSEAVDTLLLSNELSPDEYYSDDSLYFAAYSQFYLDNIEAAKNLTKQLKDKYPGSGYIKELDRILE